MNTEKAFFGALIVSWLCLMIALAINAPHASQGLMTACIAQPGYEWRGGDCILGGAK